MEELLDTLRAFGALRDKRAIEGLPEAPLGQKRPLTLDTMICRSLPVSRPLFDKAGLPANIHPFLVRAVANLGLKRLYKHQTAAIAEALTGRDVVLESPTASGKTLAFLIPMFNQLLCDEDAHALMIHPMKALSNDQRRQIQELTDALPGERRIESWIYDGDTEKEHRKLIKIQTPAILLTNPEMIHQSFLGWSSQWEDFLKKVRFIVVDEIHEYRGYFGTNFALLLRRLLMKLARNNCYPQLFLATATCSNPLEQAQHLTGRDFSLVQARRVIRPEQRFVFINPLGIPDFEFQEIYQLRISAAALACIAAGFTAITFCPSRKFTEDVTRKARREAERRNINPELIAPYRAGYTPEERRRIEDGLRNGTYKVVFCTNALELGIDIGRLDVCILAGFPDSVMSAWQRIGRAGRSFDKPVHVLFFAMNSAVDQFYAQNVDAFLQKPLDEIVIGVDNEELIDRHIPYLLYETGWHLSSEDESIIGSAFFRKAMEQKSRSRPITGGYGPNYQKLNLRGASGSIYSLVFRGTEIGTMSDAQRFREAYIGAIYSHCGKTYRVVSHGAKEIELEEADPSHRTAPNFYTIIQVIEILDGFRHENSISTFYGKLSILENFTGYKLLDEGDRVIDEEESQNARRTTAHSFWLMVENDASLKKNRGTNGFKVVEQFFRIGLPFVIPSDRHDTSTHSIITPATSSVYVYENVPGGIGIAEKMLTSWRDVLTEGTEIGRKCKCRHGCPRCIIPFGLKDAEDLRKAPGLEAAESILKLTRRPPGERYDLSVHGWSRG